jgi:hypothetical protein
MFVFQLTYWRHHELVTVNPTHSILQDTQSYCFIQTNALDVSTCWYKHRHSTTAQRTSAAYGATRLTANPTLGLKLHGEKNRKRMNFMRATESSTSLPVGWPSIENANSEPHSNLPNNSLDIERPSMCTAFVCNVNVTTYIVMCMQEVPLPVSCGYLYGIFGCVQMCLPSE